MNTQLAKKSKQFFPKLLIPVFLMILLLSATLPIGVCQTSIATNSIVGVTQYRDYWPAYSDRVFHAEGHFWVFWFNGTQDYGGYEVYSSSADGVTWTSPVQVTKSWTLSAKTYSVWFDGTYIYNTLVWFDHFNNQYITYMRGVPNSDGTITWGTQQIAQDSQPITAYDFVQISADSNGYPWIAYETYNYSTGIAAPFLIKSSTNDGTWQTAQGFPYQLLSENTNPASLPPFGQAVYPLTNGKMVVFYVYNNIGYAKAWTGSSWLPTVQVVESVLGSNGGNWQWSAVSQNDSLHIVFLKFTVGYERYDYATNSFTDAATVTQDQTVTINSHVSVSLDPINGQLYCFWTNNAPANTIYYSRYFDKQWTSSSVLLKTASEDISSPGSISTSTIAYDNYVGMLYNTDNPRSTANSTWYTVNFAYFNTLDPKLDITSTPAAQGINVTYSTWIIFGLFAAIIAVAVLTFMQGRSPSNPSPPK
jgi:hypothetical protein